MVPENCVLNSVVSNMHTHSITRMYPQMDGLMCVCNVCEHVCAHMCSGTNYILSTKVHILLPKWGIFEGSHLVRRLRLEPVWGIGTYLGWVNVRGENSLSLNVLTKTEVQWRVCGSVRNVMCDGTKWSLLELVFLRVQSCSEPPI